MDGKLNKEKSGFVEIFVIAVIVIAFAGLGTVILGGYANSYMEQSSTGIYKGLVAKVKGSIYQTGEKMSVFGTCVDAYDIPVVNATGTLSAWYPNGTQYINNSAMMLLTPGYFLWEGYMPIVEGTYLTEFVCTAMIGGVSQTAVAWGEWQNPLWANQIGDIANLTNLTYIEVLNVSSEINLTQQMILDTQVIANGSVDRNNSLLADLLYYLVNKSDECCPACGNLTWIEYGQGSHHNENDNSCEDEGDENNDGCNDEDRVGYWRWWTIKVKAYDVNNDMICSPDIACLINTTQTPNQVYMDVEGSHFTFSEFIYTRGPFEWDTECICT